MSDPEWIKFFSGYFLIVVRGKASFELFFSTKSGSLDLNGKNKKHTNEWFVLVMLRSHKVIQSPLISETKRVASPLLTGDYCCVKYRVWQGSGKDRDQLSTKNVPRSTYDGGHFSLKNKISLHICIRLFNVKFRPR